MVVIILVILYIINVFVTRWLNKIAYLKLKDNDTHNCSILPFMWFIPIFPAIILVFIILFHGNNNKFINKFNGNDW
jgi:hypothetical protein